MEYESGGGKGGVYVQATGKANFSVFTLRGMGMGWCRAARSAVLRSASQMLDWPLARHLKARLDYLRDLTAL
jgi:hypothetical protein